jgi:hypothetical protein
MYVSICSSFLSFRILNARGFAGEVLCGSYELIKKGSNVSLRDMTLM